MAYIQLGIQREMRERWNVALITHLRPDMKLQEPFTPDLVARCPQGQTLEWFGYDLRDRLHWFGVTAVEPLCSYCWERSRCPREFSFKAELHEILFGAVPLSSRTAQHLLSKVRPWIEPAQSYEKNQLGLGAMFLNSLRLTWTMGLLADTAVLLRGRAMLSRPPKPPSPLHALMPRQLIFGFE
jgi:hypothetical protein